MSDYASVDGLTVEQDGSVLRLELGRPGKRNAIDDTMMVGLLDAIDQAGRDESVRVIVLGGAGDHFCAGADIVARNAPATAAAAGSADPPPRPRVGRIQRRVPSSAHRLIPMMLNVQTPIVCRVQGWAAGIGFQLALAADFTLAADDATFWEPFTERGFTPDSGATWMLPRMVGVARARELLLLGRKLTGVEAAEWGLVHRSVAADQLDAAVADVADRLATGPTVALGLTKWLLRAGPGTELEAQLQNEALALELSSRSNDFGEGLRAFTQKRPPEFTGR
ncbi:MAG: enoyl-CoA hydratase/isomerase family protein [Acidimicrobiales bacterium]